MILRDIDFGHINCASGARNLFGEGYWHSRFVDWEGSTFVAKTTTLNPRMEPEKNLGNMRLDPETLQPIDKIPDCISVRPLSGAALNAVGLSGPGAKNLLERGQWQGRTEPFFLSFMSVAPTKEERLEEYRAFVRLLLKHKYSFRARFGLEVNLTCPNVGLGLSAVVSEAHESLDILSELEIPLVPKLNHLVAPQAAAEIAAHPQCDALCIPNTLPFGKLPNHVNWRKYFGTDDPAQSPLAKYGGGGLSGPPLFPLTCAWLREFRALDPYTPVNAGGGVFSKRNAFTLLALGATAVFLGTVAMPHARPWRVQKIIRAVNNYMLRERWRFSFDYKGDI